MRQGSIGTLAAIAIVAVLTAGLALWHSLAAVAPKQTLDRLFLPGLASELDAVAEIKITTFAGAVLVKRINGENNSPVWVLPDKDGYPVASGKAAALLERLSTLKLIEAKTADPARYAALGLADSSDAKNGTKRSAAREIQLLDASDKSLADVVIGDVALSLGRTGGGVYVRRLDDPKAYLAEGIIDVPATAADWLPQTLFALNDPQEIAGATVTEKGTTVFTIARAPSGKDLTFTPPVKGKPNQGHLLQLLATPAGLGFDDVRRASASQKPSRVIDFHRADGGIYTLKLFAAAKSDDNKGLWVGAEESGVAQADGFNQAHAAYQYHLPEYRAAVLTRTPAEFVQKSIKTP